MSCCEAHVINNAYGVQASTCVHQIDMAMRTGRVDAVVQSLDKNFLVPVGGAIVCSASREVVDSVAKLYPGRASAAPALDFFITMLQMVGPLTTCRTTYPSTCCNVLSCPMCTISGEEWIPTTTCRAQASRSLYA